MRVMLVVLVVQMLHMIVMALLLLASLLLCISMMTCMAAVVGSHPILIFDHTIHWRATLRTESFATRLYRFAE